MSFTSHDHMAKRSHYCIMIFLTLKFFLWIYPPHSFYILYFYLPFFSILSHCTTPIFTIQVFIIQANLEKDMARTTHIEYWKILDVQRQTHLQIHEELPRPQRSFHQWSQHSRLNDVIRDPHQIRQGLATNSCQESHPDSIPQL